MVFILCFVCFCAGFLWWYGGGSGDGEGVEWVRVEMVGGELLGVVVLIALDCMDFRKGRGMEMSKGMKRKRYIYAWMNG